MDEELSAVRRKGECVRSSVSGGTGRGKREKSRYAGRDVIAVDADGGAGIGRDRVAVDDLIVVIAEESAGDADGSGEEVGDVGDVAVALQEEFPVGAEGIGAVEEAVVIRAAGVIGNRVDGAGLAGSEIAKVDGREIAFVGWVGFAGVKRSVERERDDASVGTEPDAFVVRLVYAENGGSADGGERVAVAIDAQKRRFSAGDVVLVNASEFGVGDALAVRTEHGIICEVATDFGDRAG